MIECKYSLSQLNDIALKIESSNFEYSSIERFIHGKKQVQTVGSFIKKIHITKNNIYLKSIIIDCEADIIKSMTFYGIIQINFNELLLAAIDYKEIYSVHDDLYFYNYFLPIKGFNRVYSFFEPSHKRIDSTQNITDVSNISIKWIQLS